jgi:hypothetical protein
MKPANSVMYALFPTRITQINPLNEYYIAAVKDTRLFSFQKQSCAKLKSKEKQNRPQCQVSRAMAQLQQRLLSTIGQIQQRYHEAVTPSNC